MKLIIFGFGNTGRKLYDEIINYKLDTVVAFVDNNTELCNNSYEGIPVILPADISKYKYDSIVIASMYEKEILLQLENMNTQGDIFGLAEYHRYSYTKKRYDEMYLSVEFETGKKIFDKKIVVYTAITGNYDALNEPKFLDHDIQYICFTDNKNIQSDIWDVKYISDNFLDPMYLAKRVKLFPNEYLSGYDTSVWVDGKFQVIGDIRKYISKYEKNKTMLCFPHFERNCLYDEAARCLADGIGVKREILNQITSYFDEGYPFDNGLYEGGCIVRKHNDETIKKIMSDWWDEITKFSNRDQISLPYVLKKNSFIPDICDLDLYNNKWLKCTRNFSKDKRK